MIDAVPAAAPVAPVLVSVEKIWDRAEYCAFTDLVRFGDRWFCAFREGVKHWGDLGTVRVVTSADGRSWQSAASHADKGLDLRDPKLCVVGDGRLMLLAAARKTTGDTVQGIYSKVSFSRDGREWSPLVQVVPDGHWLWRVTWHHGLAYGVSKLGDAKVPKRGFLWKSRNGTDYQVVHEFDVPGMSETTLRLDGEEMIALARRTGPGGGPGWIGTSRPPYSSWHWYDTGERLGGPNFLVLPGGRLWATSRMYVEGKPSRTVLFDMTRQSFRPALTLPSGGDTSYAGMVWHDGLLWVSYYSAHEGKPSIYLAKIRIP
jgi:hypothetical protein